VKEVEAKVAEVLDAARVALNIGRYAGVEKGQNVTLWRLVEVTDPDTGDVLGAVRLDKLRMIVEDVYDRFCIASVRRQSNLAGTVMFGATKKIRIGPGDADDQYVAVSVGDEATVYLNDSE
jgi:hypothetical protein